MIELQDRSRIAAFLVRDPYLHLYGLGDLDDFFWPQTRWFGLEERGLLKAVCFLYTALTPPIFQALASPSDLPSLRQLVQQVEAILPRVIYAHLSPGLEQSLPGFAHRCHHGLHLKMGLAAQSTRSSESERDEDFKPIKPQHAPELLDLYEVSYPSHAFDARMLETGRYLGLWKDRQLVAAGGVHVYSPAYGVAALGNITTHPEFRGQGIATAITRRLCQILRKDVQFIGLNVKVDNASARACYNQVGFRQTSEYHEWTFERR